ncbi:hypothetical protein [Streptomyces sp. ERV7]|nr:hypothetical protein [Streptomyces sp. ERV7]
MTENSPWRAPRTAVRMAATPWWHEESPSVRRHLRAADRGAYAVNRPG